MRLRKAVLKSFNPTDYEATVQLTGSYKAYLKGVTVARNLPAAEMALGRKVAVLFLTSITRKRQSSSLSTANPLSRLQLVSLLGHAGRDALQDAQDTDDSSLDINRLLRQHPGNMGVQSPIADIGRTLFSHASRGQIISPGHQLTLFNA